MATYAELYTLQASNDGQTLKEKVRTAINIAAFKVATGADTESPFDQTAGADDKRKLWIISADAFNPSNDLVQQFWNAMLAKNDSATVAAIIASTDPSVQSNVETFVDVFSGN